MDINLEDFRPTSLGEGVRIEYGCGWTDPAFVSQMFIFLCLICFVAFCCGAFVFYEDYKKLKDIKRVTNKGYKKWRHDRSI